MKTPIYISFYTTGTPYEKECKELAETLNYFDLPHEIGSVTSLGNWCLNINLKSQYIRRAMQSHPDRPIVWLDADARVLKMPSLFYSLDCDIAYVVKDGWELLSSTMYFAPTQVTRELVDLWVEACKEMPGIWDQKNLQRVIEREPNRWRVTELPQSYAAIFDADMCPADEVVITQLQASRRLSGLV